MKPTFVRRLLVALAVLATAASASAYSLWPESLPKPPSLYVIHGYLDQAPEDTPIRDRIEISVDHHRRMLLVTWYGTPGETSLDRDLSRNMVRPFGIRGAEDLVSRIAQAPAGARIEGTFAAYTSGSPWLLVSELTLPGESQPAS